MKKLLALLFVLLITVYGCGKKESGTTTGEKDKPKTEDTKTSKDFEISDSKSYHVVYAMTGQDAKGIKMTMEVYIKGSKARSEVSTETGGVTMKGTGYYKDKMVYTVMDIAGKKMGFKINPGKLQDDGQAKNYDAYIMKAKDFLKDMEKTGTEEVLGYSCNVYKDKDGNKFSMFKDQILLKFEGKSGTITATNIETNLEKDDSFFEPPKDVDFSEMDLSGFKNLKK